MVGWYLCTNWIGILSFFLRYDSVIITGQLRWQDRLNSLNLPFFLSADSMFTNYFWPPHYPSLCAQYLLSIDPATLGSKPKTLQDIFIGVDVWGRGSHGGGGFGSYRAITHVDPEFLGLSVALFGPAWSWESEQDKKGWDWERWWTYERKLWVGPQREGEVVHVPPMPPGRNGEPPCPHGEFQPISAFFPRRPPPNPLVLPFFTTFSPGVGYGWYVEGRSVMHKTSGWTDIDKQTSLGDLVWPRPLIAWEGDAREEPVPAASSTLCLDDAWNGGSSLRLTLSSPGSSAEDAFFRCVWIPIQSLAFTAQTSYAVTLVYKVRAPSAEVDLGLSVKLPPGSSAQELEMTPSTENETGELTCGWSRTSIQFFCPAEKSGDLVGAVGVIVGIAAEDPSQPYEVDLQIGQLSVYPTLPVNASPPQPRILWADCEPASSKGQPTQSTYTLTWDVSSSFEPVSRIELGSVEDPRPPWIIDRSDNWFPSFAYCNIYAQAPKGTTLALSVLKPEDATFVGTTGFDGVKNRFVLDRQAFPEGLRGGPVRFYVQGVTDRGRVLPWDLCAFVDAT